MLETLAGKLKWERTGDGIRVVIPARIPWLWTLTVMANLFMLLHFIVEVFDKTRGITGPVSFGPEWIGLCLSVIWFTMVFTIKQILMLNPAEMSVQSRTLGIEVNERTYATSRLRSCDFGSSEYGDLVSMDKMSRIQIDRDCKTRNFAFGITEQEADTLIEKMLEVYKFPEGPAR